MNKDDEKVKAAIAEQACERFVANDAEPLDARESEALATWFKASPVHVAEFLGVSVVARDLRALEHDPEYSLDAVLTWARAADEPVHIYGSRDLAPVRGSRIRQWAAATATLAACLVLAVGAVSWWDSGRIARAPIETAAAELHLRTGHGEQLVRRLADDSVLHLNGDSAVSIQYRSTERLVTLISGEASFEVAHQPDRPFRVSAGAARVVAIGTQFDVRIEQVDTVVTVLEGRVTVQPSLAPGHPTPMIELGADQQARIIAGSWPPTLLAVDAQRTTSWLHRQVSFDDETLEQVAAEYNRYAQKPIVIETPALRTLRISGVFSTDDSTEFVAFLRSLDRVRVEVTLTQIRVFGE